MLRMLWNCFKYSLDFCIQEYGFTDPVLCETLKKTGVDFRKGNITADRLNLYLTNDMTSLLAKGRHFLKGHTFSNYLESKVDDIKPIEGDDPEDIQKFKDSLHIIGKVLDQFCDKPEEMRQILDKFFAKRNYLVKGGSMTRIIFALQGFTVDLHVDYLQQFKEKGLKIKNEEDFFLIRL